MNSGGFEMTGKAHRSKAKALIADATANAAA